MRVSAGRERERVHPHTHLRSVQEEIGDTGAEDVHVLLGDVREADARGDLLPGPQLRRANQVLLARGREAQQPEDAPRDLAQYTQPNKEDALYAQTSTYVQRPRGVHASRITRSADI